MTEDNKQKILEWAKVIGIVLLLFLTIIVLHETVARGANYVARVAAVLLVLENGYFAYKVIKKCMDGDKL